MRSSCAGPMMDCGVRAARVRARCAARARKRFPRDRRGLFFANVKCSGRRPERLRDVEAIDQQHQHGGRPQGR